MAHFSLEFDLFLKFFHTFYLILILEMPDSSTSPTVAVNPSAASKTEPVAAAKNDEPLVAKESGPGSRYCF
jgi:hypothetical protein